MIDGESFGENAGLELGCGVVLTVGQGVGDRCEQTGVAGFLLLLWEHEVFNHCFDPHLFYCTGV